MRRSRTSGSGGASGLFGKLVDLTHTFTPGFPVYTGDPPSKVTLKTFENDGFYSQGWTFGEHSGTHMDAPGHFAQGGRLVPDLRRRSSCCRSW